MKNSATGNITAGLYGILASYNNSVVYNNTVYDIDAPNASWKNAYGDPGRNESCGDPTKTGADR